MSNSSPILSYGEKPLSTFLHEIYCYHAFVAFLSSFFTSLLSTYKMKHVILVLTNIFCKESFIQLFLPRFTDSSLFRRKRSHIRRVWLWMEMNGDNNNDKSLPQFFNCTNRHEYQTLDSRCQFFLPWKEMSGRYVVLTNRCFLKAFKGKLLLCKYIYTNIHICYEGPCVVQVILRDALAMLLMYAICTASSHYLFIA